MMTRDGCLSTSHPKSVLGGRDLEHGVELAFSHSVIKFNHLSILPALEPDLLQFLLEPAMDLFQKIGPVRRYRTALAMRLPVLHTGWTKKLSLRRWRGAFRGLGIGRRRRGRRGQGRGNFNFGPPRQRVKGHAIGTLQGPSGFWSYWSINLIGDWHPRISVTHGRRRLRGGKDRHGSSCLSGRSTLTKILELTDLLLLLLLLQLALLLPVPLDQLLLGRLLLLLMKCSAA